MEPPGKTRKRRVPDTERQRVSISCDRCKTRKIRCVRMLNSHGPCEACALLSLDCASTLPRKQRIYGSGDQLLVRCRSLETLVKRLFPGHVIDTVDDIRELARRQGVDLSDLEEGGDMQHPIMSESSTSGDDRLFASIQELQIPEGASIPAPKGGCHYVGPASSYLFANTIRHLVKKSSLYSLSFDQAGHRRQRRANEFTSSNRTTALEARIQGHPVMAAETDDASPMSDSTGFGGTDGAAPSPQVWTGSAPRRWTVDLLPPRRLSEKLVKAFFERVHPDFTLFHRGTFQVRYESTWTSKQPDEIDGSESGWLCALYMIYVLGAQSLERDGLDDARAIQSRYLGIVIREGLQRLVLTATLANVQALALLSLYQHNAGERNTAWMMIGHACRMAVALGMQHDGEHANFDFIERNSRRMVWWNLYLFEQNLSFTLGRPSVTSQLDISTSLPDEVTMEGGVAPSDFLEHAVKLADISAKIKRFVASVSTDFDRPESLARKANMATRLHDILIRWDEALPPHLRPTASFATTKHLRAVLLLHGAFSHLRSVIGRPFLLCKINYHLETVKSPLPLWSDTLPAAISPLALISIDAARDCLKTMVKLASNGLLEGELWYDYYYVHHSSLVLSLPFLLDPTDQQTALDRGIISSALNFAQKSRLAPTYRILINVSIQFAKIVGIGPDDDASRPASPHSGVAAGMHLYPRDVTTSSQDWNTDSAPVFSQEASVPAGFGLSGLSRQVDADANALQWSALPSYPNQADSASSWSLLPMLSPTPSSQPLSLEQLLGMTSSTPANPARNHLVDLAFSDLHNFGFTMPNAPSSGPGQPAGTFANSEAQGGDGSSNVTMGSVGEIPWDFFAGEDWAGFCNDESQGRR